MNNNLPVVSIINCTKGNACKELFEKISARLKKNDGSFMIDNKYYSAKIKLTYHSFGTDFQISPETEAVLFIFDISEPESFDLIKEKLNLIEEINPIVKLIICNNFVPSNGFLTEPINNWVIANDFELIELENNIDHSDDEDNDFPDIVGFDRIIEALNCNSWSNSVLNDIAKNSPFAYKSLNSIESDPDLSDSSSNSNPELHTKNMELHKSQYTTQNIHKERRDLEMLNQNTLGEVISSENMLNKELSNECILNKEISNENMLNNEITNENMLKKEIYNENMLNKEISNENILNKELSNENMLNKEISNDNMLNKEIFKERTKDFLNFENTEINYIHENIESIQNTELQIEDGIKCKQSDVDNFEDLFQNLHEIKEKAQRLSFDERKKYAEEMVKKFWLSMGGDENEFDDLSDDDT